MRTVLIRNAGRTVAAEAVAPVSVVRFASQRDFAVIRIALSNASARNAVRMVAVAIAGSVVRVNFAVQRVNVSQTDNASRSVRALSVALMAAAVPVESVQAGPHAPRSEHVVCLSAPA